MDSKVTCYIPLPHKQTLSNSQPNHSPSHTNINPPIKCKEIKKRLSLQWIMPPILQRLITLTIRILLRRLLLRQMPFTIRHYLAHMIDVFVRVPRGVFGRVVFEDGDDFAAAIIPKSY